MTHVDKAWRNESKVAPHTHKDTFTIYDTQQLIESQNTWNAAPFIDGAEISGFPLMSQQGSVLGRVRKYLLLFTWTYRFGKCKFSAILSHTCLDQKKKQKAPTPSLPYCSLSESAGMILPWGWENMTERSVNSFSRKAFCYQCWRTVLLHWNPRECKAVASQVKADKEVLKLVAILLSWKQQSLKHMKAHHKQSMTCPWHPLSMQWPFAFAPILWVGQSQPI